MHLHRHYSFSSLAILPFLTLLGSVNAKTDLTGCTQTDISSPAGASYAWIVPGTGELCEFLDCGGGRAPPKLNVPGCAAYTGTQTYSPSFMAGFGAAATGGAIIGEGVGVGSSAAIEGGAAITAVATPSAAVDVDGSGDADTDGLDDEQSANADTSTISSAAATTASTTDATMTSIKSPDQEAVTTPWPAIPTRPSQPLQATTSLKTIASTSLLSTAESSTTGTADPASSSSSISSTGSAVTTESLSMSRSWVKTVPTFTRVAADGNIHRAGVTESAAASLIASTGAAAGRIGVFGDAGVVGIMLGALFML